MVTQEQGTKRATAATALMAGVLMAGLVLRVAYLTVDRFHADEALYAGWALLIRDRDPLLLSVPVDKPPLFLYTLAGSAMAFGSSEVAFRLPNIAASLLGIALVYRLGKSLYSRAIGLLAALFLALSPFDILFARTAFTDPMLVLWVLGALCAVGSGHWFVGGICIGLAVASKQHAWLLIPLVLAVGLVQALVAAEKESLLRTAWTCLSRGILGLALPFALVVAWDSARWGIRPGYWEQSTLSYGGIAFAPASEWGQRLGEWWQWARYLIPSPVLIVLFVGGGAVLLIGGWRSQRLADAQYGRDEETRPCTSLRQVALDTIWVGYGIGYVALHVLLQFSVWDRYLLPLAAPIAVVLARIVIHLCDRMYPSAKIPPSSHPFYLERRRGGRAVLAAVVCIAATIPAWRAAHNGYPIGGEHWAYQGLDQIAAFLRQNAPPDAVLYHHWLRWHYSYYLYGTSFELRWWQSGEHLRREAMRTPDRAQYIVLPDWHTLEPYAEGLTFHLLYEAHRQDGTVSMRLYRIEVSQQVRSPAGGKVRLQVCFLHLTERERQHIMQPSSARIECIPIIPPFPQGSGA